MEYRVDVIKDGDISKVVINDLFSVETISFDPDDEYQIELVKKCMRLSNILFPAKGLIGCLLSAQNNLLNTIASLDLNAIVSSNDEKLNDVLTEFLGREERLISYLSEKIRVLGNEYEDCIKEIKNFKS